MKRAVFNLLWLGLFLVVRPCTAGEGLLGWGALVGAPELDGWITSGLAETTPLEVRRERLTVARRSTSLARAEGRPTAAMEADWRAGRMKEMGREDDEDVASFAGRGALTWELDFFGRVRAAVGAARYAEEGVAEELRAHELAVATELSGIYVEGRWLGEQKRLRREVLAAKRAVADYFASRADAGLVQAEQVDRAEASVRNALRRVEETEEALAVLAARWRYLAPSDSVPELQTHEGVIGSAPAPPSESALHAYAASRPDVRAARAAWMQDERVASASARDRLPKVDAVLSAELEGPSPLEDPEAWTAWAGVRLSLPVLAPRRAGTAARDRARVAVGESLYRDAVGRAVLDLQQSYAQRVRVEQQLRAARGAADRLGARLRSTEQRQAKGLVALPDVEQARTAWLMAQEEALMLKARTLQTHLELVRACGGPQAIESGPVMP